MNTLITRSIRTAMRHMPFILTTMVMLLFGSGGTVLAAAAQPPSDCDKGTSTLDCNALIGGWENWVPDSCAAASALANSSGDPATATTAQQEANAKIIIGIAKSENFGQYTKQAVLVALMTALQESHITILANTTIPLSMSNPNKQGQGSDHDSLGIFQQRVSTNWSTLGTTPTQAVVNQLMDPEYEAEAFFGTEPGTNAPSALSKGLHRVKGWETMAPGVAAQKVQVSAFPDAYNKWQNTAQQLSDKLFDSSPAIPLPVAFSAPSAEAAATNNACNVPTDYNCTAPSASAKILCEAQKYKGIWYQLDGGHQGYDAYKRGCPDPTHPANNQASGSGGPNNGNPSPCAVDCSSLVSLAVDDAFGQKFNWVVADIVGDRAHWQKIDLSKAQPGDVVTVDTEHVEIFVSLSGKTIHTFGAHHTGTQTGQTQASSDYYNGVYHYIGPGA